MGSEIYIYFALLYYYIEFLQINMASNLALIALSLTLGLLFVAIGSIKLTPAISSDMHKEMVRIIISINLLPS